MSANTRCGTPRLAASATRPGLQIPQFAEVTINGSDPAGDFQDVRGEVLVIGADARLSVARGACHGGYASVSTLMSVYRRYLT